MRASLLKTVFLATAGMLGACGKSRAPEPNYVYALERWEIKSDTLRLYATDLNDDKAKLDTFVFLYRQNGQDIPFADARLTTPKHNKNNRSADRLRDAEFSIFTGRRTENIETKFVMDYFTTNIDFYDSMHARKVIERNGIHGPVLEGFETVLKIVKQPVPKEQYNGNVY